MTRNLKALGLAMAALFACGAVAAATASAQNGVLTSDGPVTLDAEEVGAANENALTYSPTERIRCPGSDYTGHPVDETPHEGFLQGGETTVTITPHYNQANCEAESGGEVFSLTVFMTSCDYVFNLGETTPAGNEEGTYGVTADVVCNEAGDEIHIEAYSGQSHGFRVCTTTVPEQTGLTGAHATDEGNGHLRIKGTFHSIEAAKSGLCGSGNTTEAEIHINVTVKGTNEAGGATDISLSH